MSSNCCGSTFVLVLIVAGSRVSAYWVDPGSGGSKAATKDSGSKILHFHAIFEDICSNNRLVPPRGLSPRVWEMLYHVC